MNLNVMKIKTLHWVAKKMPRTIVYYCGMNVMYHATSGKYSSTVVPELSGMEALKRFADDHQL